MLNVLWPIFIVLSVIYAFFNGNIEKVSNGFFTSTESAVQLTITFFGTICLWNGMMQIIKKTSAMEILTRKLKPLMKFLFPELKANSKASQEISMNLIANLLGLGNAATPLGLKAMQTMQQENKKKDTLSNSMAMFILLNTASLQLIPTNVIAIRNSLGSEAPSSIIVSVWIATLVAALVGVTSAKFLMKRF